MSSGSDLLDRIRVATADEYRIEREIGRGGMAAVFLARDIALDRRVAIKVMLPDLVNVHGVQDRFVIEARTAAHLDHPGIVAVYAVRQRAGLLYIVMKYIEGHTLEAVLRSQGQIDPTATALIGSRVADALGFAHGEGVIHRDVKPSNIMIDPRGRPVVTDFGIARVMTGQSITVAGSVLGTPTHMSPEQCRGLPATAASDQYSLGITLYEMLTGRPPFTGELFELIDGHREKAPPPLSEFVAGVAPALEQTVMRMLAKNPADRWGSMAEVSQRLSTHTTSRRGDERLRATLVLSDGEETLGAREESVASVDVLTPPGSVSTPASPVPASGPPSPVPISVPPAALAPADFPPEPRVAGGSRGRTAVRIGAVVLFAILAATVYWTGKGGSQSAPPAVTVDSVKARAVRDSAVRDSVARDSAARVVAAKDSARRDSLAKDSVVRDSTAKALAARDSAARAKKVVSRKDSVATRRPRSDSLGVECARLLEQASLGEKLTDAERQLLKTRCPRKGS